MYACTDVSHAIGNNDDINIIFFLSTNTALTQALMDLEDHLSDIDMARDFHTLGGWRPLVALLDPEHERLVVIK